MHVLGVEISNVSASCSHQGPNVLQGCGATNCYRDKILARWRGGLLLSLPRRHITRNERKHDLTIPSGTAQEAPEREREGER